MTQQLTDKIALVTGAGQGIGRGIALCLAREGAHVAVNDLAQNDHAAAVVDEIRALGRQALVVSADVSQRAEVEAMVETVSAHFGRLDIAVANAGMSVRQPVIEAEWDGVLRTLEVTQFGVYHTCQFAARQMLKQPAPAVGARGKIVIIGSVHEEQPVPESAAYNMAKAAVNHLGRTLAGELAAEHINVNVINPGWINTPGERKYFTEEQLEIAGRNVPWGRIGTPEDIGQVAAFLASDAADYITGASLRVDGGYMLGLRLR
ncbi:MAG: glucose 1-dehydrogenase [Anaerolineae bacterium]|nr:glucose 1-dehydrogenase [Anaerolineae bacterium]